MAGAVSEQILASFQKFDSDGSGTISREELAATLLSLNPRAYSDESKVEALLNELDINGDGVIDYSEFVAWVMGGAELANFVLDNDTFKDEIVRELTWARTNYGEVVAALRDRLRHYSGKDYCPPERKGVAVVTKEGTHVVEEAIAYVQSLEPMGGLGDFSELGLAFAGEDHIADIGKTGVVSHDSSDGTSAGNRAKRYGRFRCHGECLWYGSTEADARTMVLDLIVDDGVPSRGHRTGVLNPTYEEVGCAVGPHATFGLMSCMEFACGWTRDEDACLERLNAGPFKVSAQAQAKAKAKAKTQWDLGQCGICGQEIRGGRVSEVPGLGKMHADCFKCNSCDKALRGVPFQIQERKPYCKPCHAEQHGEKCAKCNTAIAGAMIRCSLGAFHADCVVCSQCDQVVGRTPFSTSGGVITCQKCSGGRGGPPPGAPQGVRGGAARAPKAAPKARAPKAAPRGQTKPKAKASMGGARSAAYGIAMDYANLE